MTPISCGRTPQLRTMFAPIGAREVDMESTHRTVTPGYPSNAIVRRTIHERINEPIQPADGGRATKTV